MLFDILIIKRNCYKATKIKPDMLLDQEILKTNVCNGIHFGASMENIFNYFSVFFLCFAFVLYYFVPNDYSIV